MSEINTGGPAFPQAFAIGDRAVVDGGMTLRDYFAAKAINGLLSAGGGGATHTLEVRAIQAYKLADAMLKARAGEIGGAA